MFWNHSNNTFWKYLVSSFKMILEIQAIFVANLTLERLLGVVNFISSTSYKLKNKLKTFKSKNTIRQRVLNLFKLNWICKEQTYFFTNSLPWLVNVKLSLNKTSLILPSAWNWIHFLCLYFDLYGSTVINEVLVFHSWLMLNYSLNKNQFYFT